MARSPNEEGGTFATTETHSSPWPAGMNEDGQVRPTSEFQSGVPDTDAQHITPESLAAIPSPSRRLWIGLCVVLSIFLVFAVYATHQVHWLEQFQGNVVQRNRKASLQLLRLQNDIYLLA